MSYRLPLRIERVSLPETETETETVTETDDRDPDNPAKRPRLVAAEPEVAAPPAEPEPEPEPELNFGPPREVMMLERLHAHPRDARVWMDPGPHLYYVDGRAGAYSSSTTFIHSLFSPFDAKRCVFFIMRSARHQNDPSYNYYRMTEQEILDSWDANRDRGTAMHEKIEFYWNGAFDLAAGAAEARELQHFQAFLRDYPDLRPYRTEWMVFHEELRICGSIDMVFCGAREDEVILYDWKRSKGIRSDSRERGLFPCVASLRNANFFHYSLQLNLYKYIIEAKYDKRVTQMCLLVLYPDQESYQRIEVEDWSATLMPGVIAHRMQALDFHVAH